MPGSMFVDIYVCPARCHGALSLILQKDAYSVSSCYFPFLPPFMENTYPLPLPIDIPVPSNGKNQPVTTWNGLQFSPLGAYHLRCWQGVFPGIKDFFTTYQGRFRSADLAWFSSGMNRDGNHSHPPTSFHPSLVTLHGETNSIQGRLERKALLAEVKEQLFYVVCFFKTHSVYL